MTSAPENLDYILQTWYNISHQLIRGNSFEIGSLFGLYLIAWTIYNCAEYGSLPNNTESILLLGQLKITLSKNGAMKRIDYCIRQAEFMSDFVLKPYFYTLQSFDGSLNTSISWMILMNLLPKQF